MSRTKIIVLQLKEIIYTALFVALGIFLILLLIFMFTNKKDKEAVPTTQYVPGVYTSSVIFNNHYVDVEVIVDKNHVNAVNIKQLDPIVETFYPTLVPSLNNIEDQLMDDIALDDIEIGIETKHTSNQLVLAIEHALQKARVGEIHN